jgi:hypothetical protein
MPEYVGGKLLLEAPPRAQHRGDTVAAGDTAARGYIGARGGRLQQIRLTVTITAVEVDTYQITV